MYMSVKVPGRRNFSWAIDVFLEDHTATDLSVRGPTHLHVRTDMRRAKQLNRINLP